MKRTKSVFIATWFYSGCIPSFIPRMKMAGTYGSLFSLPLCWFILYFGGENSVHFMHLAAWITFYTGILVIKKAEQDIGPQIDWKGKVKFKDQNEIVIDEVLGMLITCLPLTFTKVDNIYLAFFMAFLLFRFFDIVKIPPTKVFDRMKNPFGVMMDDVVAGLYAALCLLAIINKFHL